MTECAICFSNLAGVDWHNLNPQLRKDSAVYVRCAYVPQRIIVRGNMHYWGRLEPCSCCGSIVLVLYRAPCFHRSYKEWHISLDVGMSYEACEAFALAVPRDRTQSNPLKVTVSTDHYKRLAQRMEPLLDVYPCVDFDFVELF